MVQPEPVTVYETVPVPAPPLVKTLVAVPTRLSVVVSLPIVNVGWVPSVNLKVTGSEVTEPLVAVTGHEPTASAFSTPVMELIEQTAPVVAKVYAPEPEPPEAVTVMVVPTLALSEEFVIVTDGAAAVKTKVFDAAFAAA